jgi:integrase
MEGNYAMAATMPHIQWWKGSYRFRRPIPKEHQPTFGNKKYFPTKALGTTDEAEANRLVIPHIMRTNQMLKLAEAGEWPPTSDEAFNRMVKRAETGEWTSASDDAIELIAYQWFGSLDREDPFDNENELATSLRRYVVTNGINIGKQIFERLKREAISEHSCNFGGYAPMVEERRKARMQVTVALSRGGSLPASAVRTLNGDQQPTASDVVSGTTPVSISQGGRPVSIWTIYDDWASESRAAAKTVYSWRQIIKKLTDHVGHDDAARIAENDVITWKDGLVRSQLAPKTIENHLTIVKTLFNWAMTNRRIPTNPASAVRYKAKADPSRKKLGYDNEQTKRILLAAQNEKEPHKRWVPWLGAGTGARVDEICGAMVRDIDVIDGIHCLHIRLDHREKGASLKNENSVRVVPLHPAIITDGFLAYVASLSKNGPLFPNVTPDRFGKRGGNGTKTIGRWIRKKIGITDPRIQPNHAWRHRFKSQSRKAGIEEEIHDCLTGNSGGGTGRDYGDYGIDVLAEAVAKINVPVS